MRIPYQLNLLGLAIVVGAATMVVSHLDRKIVPNLASGAKVTASSRCSDSPDPMRLVDGDVFQTGMRSENQQNPWVQLELRQEQTIGHVTVYNHLDWREPRAIQMILKLSPDGRVFSEVARIAEPFARWDVRVPNRGARFIRVDVPTNGFLELNEIEVR